MSESGAAKCEVLITGPEKARARASALVGRLSPHGLIAVVQVKDAVGDSGGFLSRDLREPRLRQPSPPPYKPKYFLKL